MIPQLRDVRLNSCEFKLVHFWVNTFSPEPSDIKKLLNSLESLFQTEAEDFSRRKGIIVYPELIWNARILTLRIIQNIFCCGLNS